jgi:inner membrane protein
MTGRTHDLAAFTALSYIITIQPIPKMSLATALVALSANFIGGLAPDIDQPTADLWNRIPAGSIIGRILCPILGGHRFISHSLLGIAFFGIILHYALQLAHSVLLVDMNIVWWAFMIGFVSHLLMDTITREGVPWLFPIPIHIGIPPFKFMRIKTGGMIEKSIIFPGLILANGYIYYHNYGHVLTFLRHFAK